MTHSADLAFLELARERELVPEKRLQEAMLAAERDRVPLERVLIQSGLLRPSVCEHLLQLRNRRALLCQSCGGYTYILSSQEGDIFCEHCGRLLRLSDRVAPDATPLPPARSGPISRSAPRRPPPRRPPPAPTRGPGPAPLRVPTARQARPSDEGETGSAMRPRRRASVPPPRPGPRPMPAAGQTEVFLTRMIGRLEDADDPLVERLIESAGAALARTVEERYLGGLEQRIAEEVTGRVVEVFTRGEVQLPRVTQVAVDHALDQVGLVVDGLREELHEAVVRRESQQNAEFDTLRGELDDLRGALGSEEVRLDAIAQERLQAMIAARLQGPLPESLQAGLEQRAEQAVDAALSQQLQSMGLAPAGGEPWRAKLAREVLDALRVELTEHGLNALPPRITEEVVAHAEAVAERSDTASDIGHVSGAVNEEQVQQAAARTLETLWEHLEQHGVAGFPERVVRDLGDRDALTAHVLESIWGHLEEHGLAGFPERIQADVASAASGGAPTGEAADAVANVLASIWGHLEEHGLEGFPDRVRDEARQISAEAAAELEARLTRIEERLGLDERTQEGLGERVARIEARLAAGGASDADYASEEFMEQVVNLAMERVTEADTDRRVTLLSGQIWPRIRAQLDEQLQGWEPTGWTDALRELAQAAVDEVVGGLDLQGLPDRVARYAVDQVRGRGHESAEAERAAEEAVQRAVANLDYETLAQRVAIEATRPLMQAIDGRLAGLPQQVIEQTTERVLAELQTRPD
ncbi:MAG: hypothetical protein KDD82_23365 [Planctomycetes bacterium]|nr:hypothetical protein [Planctomycetota bacterium]